MNKIELEIVQGCVFTKDINKAMMISDAMESGTVQINSAPARGPDHFPFQVKPTKSIQLVLLISWWMARITTSQCDSGKTILISNTHMLFI